MPQGYASRIGPSEGAVPDMAIRRAERIGPTPSIDKVAQDYNYKNAEDMVNNFDMSGVTNIFPKGIQKLFTQELAEKVWKELTGLGLDKMAKSATDMITSPRHEAISSTLSNFFTENVAGRVASYQRADTSGLMRDIMTRKGNPTYTIRAPALANMDDETVARLARAQGGKIGVSPTLEEGPVSEIYKSIRHEFSHGADDLAGKNTGRPYDTDDPRYWINLAEVRARSAEPNYVRDMTGKADAYFDRDEFAPVKRVSYTEKVIDEINRGKNVAEDKANLRPGIAWNNIDPELSNTASHYFGSPGRSREYFAPEIKGHPSRVEIKTIEPRLKLPGDKNYDWENQIMNQQHITNINTPKTRTPISPSDRALQDLIYRLRGSE